MVSKFSVLCSKSGYHFMIIKTLDIIQNLGLSLFIFINIQHTQVIYITGLQH